MTLEVSAWYAGSVGRIIRCILLDEIVNSNHCIVLTQTPFFKEMIKDEKIYGCFMQDSAMAHTVNYLLTAFELVFRKWLISHRLWLAKSPYLNPCSYYLWRCWKINLCEQSSLFSITLIQYLIIEHFRNVIARIEVSPSVTSQRMYSFCDFFLGYVALTEPIVLL